jgi:hypothetical protein
MEVQVFKLYSLVMLIVLGSSLPAQRAVAQDSPKPAQAKAPQKKAEKAAVPAPRLFTSKNGYSVAPPKGWEILSIQSIVDEPGLMSDELRARYDPTMFDVMFSDNRPQEVGSANVSDTLNITMMERFPINEESVKVVKRIMVERFSKSLQDFKLLSFEIVTINGAPALRFDRTYTQDTEHLYVRQIILTGASRSATISCLMDQARAKTRLPLCDAVTASVTFR